MNRPIESVHLVSIVFVFQDAASPNMHIYQAFVVVRVRCLNEHRVPSLESSHSLLKCVVILRSLFTFNSPPCRCYEHAVD
jgi:hypothetical protein